MQELEKILEEIIEQLKAEGCIIDDAAGNRAEEIVRQHMNDNSICADCSRRKWYQIGFKDGLKSNDDWISVEERLPEEHEEGMVSNLVNVTVYDYENEKYFVGADCTFDGEWCNFGLVTGNYEVIAWRPLPEPYRLERSDGE